MRRLWADCVSAVLYEFAKARTELESFAALEKWVKLKSALVLPLRGGKQRYSASQKFHSDQMELWFSGEYEECWLKAIAIETERQTLIKKKNQSQSNASTKKLLQTMNFEDDLTQITNKKSLDELGESLRRNR